MSSSKSGMSKRHAPSRFGRNPKTDMRREIAERRAAKRDPYARSNTQVRYLRPDQIPEIADGVINGTNGVDY